jgi:hypothetical protein
LEVYTYRWAPTNSLTTAKSDKSKRSAYKIESQSAAAPTIYDKKRPWQAPHFLRTGYVCEFICIPDFIYDLLFQQLVYLVMYVYMFYL